MIKFVSISIYLSFIFGQLYSSDISLEARYISENQVTITRIDSFLFHSQIELETNYRHVARSLLNYTSEVAVELFIKMLNDDNLDFQNYAIYPLLNSGRLEIAFAKFEELLLNGKLDLMFNLYYHGDKSDFSLGKFELIKMHRNLFIPLFKKVCLLNYITHEVKYKVAYQLYYLGHDEEIKSVCNEILAEIPESKKLWKSKNPIEKKNSLLRSNAIEFLMKLDDDTKNCE